MSKNRNHHIMIDYTINWSFSPCPIFLLYTPYDGWLLGSVWYLVNSLQKMISNQCPRWFFTCYLFLICFFRAIKLVPWWVFFLGGGCNWGSYRVFIMLSRVWMQIRTFWSIWFFKKIWKLEKYLRLLKNTSHTLESSSF